MTEQLLGASGDRRRRSADLARFWSCPVCRFDVSYDSSVELSPSGYQFLTEIFEIFDKVMHPVQSSRSLLDV